MRFDRVGDLVVWTVRGWVGFYWGNVGCGFRLAGWVMLE